MLAMNVAVRLLGWLVLGVIVGPIARLLIPGKQYMSFPMTVLLGGVGGFLGGVVARNLLGWETGGVEWIAGIVGAVVAVLIYGMVAGKSSTATG